MSGQQLHDCIGFSKVKVDGIPPPMTWTEKLEKRMDLRTYHFLWGWWIDIYFDQPKDLNFDATAMAPIAATACGFFCPAKVAKPEATAAW